MKKGIKTGKHIKILQRITESLKMDPKYHSSDTGLDTLLIMLSY